MTFSYIWFFSHQKRRHYTSLARSLLETRSFDARCSEKRLRHVRTLQLSAEFPRARTSRLAVRRIPSVISFDQSSCVCTLETLTLFWRPSCVLRMRESQQLIWRQNSSHNIFNNDSSISSHARLSWRHQVANICLIQLQYVSPQSCYCIGKLYDVLQTVWNLIIAGLTFAQMPRRIPFSAKKYSETSINHKNGYGNTTYRLKDPLKFWSLPVSWTIHRIL